MLANIKIMIINWCQKIQWWNKWNQGKIEIKNIIYHHIQVKKMEEKTLFTAKWLKIVHMSAKTPKSFSLQWIDTLFDIVIPFH